MLRKGIEKVLTKDLTKKVCRKKLFLEVGCGEWDFAREIIEDNNGTWVGVDVVDGISAIKGSVDKLPFFDSTFDVVLATQCMEHWFEYGVSLTKGLKEIKRVLKNDGLVMINVPIHNHGSPVFVSGRMDIIKSAFKRAGLDVVKFEKMIPIIPVKGWKRISNKGFFSKVGYPDFLVPKSKTATSYILNIHAVKHLDFTKRVDKKRALTVASRFLWELMKI